MRPTHPSVNHPSIRKPVPRKKTTVQEDPSEIALIALMSVIGGIVILALLPLVVRWIV